MADVDNATRAYRATLQVGPNEETLTLDLPEWMDRWDARDAMHAECMNVYGERGVILLLEAV